MIRINNIRISKEIETQYTPNPLTDNLYFEPNSPRFKKIYDNTWIKHLTPTVNMSANPSCRIYLHNFVVDCPIFV